MERVGTDISVASKRTTPKGSSSNSCVQQRLLYAWEKLRLCQHSVYRVEVHYHCWKSEMRNATLIIVEDPDL